MTKTEFMCFCQVLMGAA